MSLIFVDVEANAISPASGVMTEFGAVEYKSRATFHGVLWESEPDPENPAKSQLIGFSGRVRAYDSDPKQWDHEWRTMRAFQDWLNKICIKSRPIFVSDNPAFDFQWISFYFDKTLGKNPFGHSGRRISDFYAGLKNDFYNTQKWKRYRITPHDHHPVHDALGNVEAFQQILLLADEGRL